MSGIIGMIIKPHPNPMMQRPSTINTDESHTPNNLLGPMKTLATLKNTYPKRMINVFLYLLVRMNTNGLVVA